MSRDTSKLPSLIFGIAGEVWTAPTAGRPAPNVFMAISPALKAAPSRRNSLLVYCLVRFVFMFTMVGDYQTDRTGSSKIFVQTQIKRNLRAFCPKTTERGPPSPPVPRSTANSRPSTKTPSNQADADKAGNTSRGRDGWPQPSAHFVTDAHGGASLPRKPVKKGRRRRKESRADLSQSAGIPDSLPPPSAVPATEDGSSPTTQ